MPQKLLWVFVCLLAFCSAFPHAWDYSSRDLVHWKKTAITVIAFSSKTLLEALNRCSFRPKQSTF